MEEEGVVSKHQRAGAEEQQFGRSNTQSEEVNVGRGGDSRPGPAGGGQGRWWSAS